MVTRWEFIYFKSQPMVDVLIIFINTVLGHSELSKARTIPNGYGRNGGCPIIREEMRWNQSLIISDCLIVLSTSRIHPEKPPRGGILCSMEI